MESYVALLKGINVGGNNKVPMADLRTLATGLGWLGVKTHIASGNLVFRADGDAAALATTLRNALADRMRVDVAVMVQSGTAIRAALASCPYDPVEGKHVHVFFLFDNPVIDTTALALYRALSEDLTVTGRLAWLHAPQGIGRSKLAEKLHKVITGTDMTARNLNTLRALAEMLD